tara:strand:+ start:82 stop:912 length:831 start_codon:yes stop_codon:yes gene_type:complete
MPQKKILLLGKIIRYLSRIPLRILVKFKIFLKTKKNYQSELINEQRRLFLNIDLDRKAGKDLVNKVCGEIFNHGYDESEGMFSEHLIIMGSLSIVKQKYKRILEIGTYDGKSALLLSKLFTQAEIVTIDLPSDTSDYVSSYHRESYHKKFVEERDNLLRKSEQIKFIEMNSVRLSDYDLGKFDLIWIDGAHGYPVVAIDIINAFRLIKSGGIVMLDDVHKSVKKSDNLYSSVASFEVLNLLKNNGLIDDYKLFRKRLGVKYNIKDYTEKFVGLVKF